MSILITVEVGVLYGDVKRHGSIVVLIGTVFTATPCIEVGKVKEDLVVLTAEITDHLIVDPTVVSA